MADGHGSRPAWWSRATICPKVRGQLRMDHGWIREHGASAALASAPRASSCCCQPATPWWPVARVGRARTARITATPAPATARGRLVVVEPEGGRGEDARGRHVREAGGERRCSVGSWIRCAARGLASKVCSQVFGLGLDNISIRKKSFLSPSMRRRRIWLGR